MVRRFIAPILRLIVFFLILLAPLLLASLARSEEPGDGRSLVVLRSVVLGETPGERWPRGSRVPPSLPATLLERRGSDVLVEADLNGRHVRGWADSTAFEVLDDPGLPVARLLENARRLANQGDRPVLQAAYLQEALRRDPSQLGAWQLLGATGERLAASFRPPESGQPPPSVALAARWGIRLLVTPDGRSYRYDGEAWRRIVALSPPADVAEDARLRLLLRCGLPADLLEAADPAALNQREKDLGEFLASFPTSSRRVSFLLERARILALLARQSAARGEADRALARRDSALEAASEVASTSPDATRRRAADRLVAQLTRSFPRKLQSDKPVVSSNGFRAAFVERRDGTVLQVLRPDGRPAIQPYPVRGPDPATLAFDPTGHLLVWDESPLPGRRRTRLLDLARARVFDPAALAEPEILSTGGAPVTSALKADRYTSFIGFSPDGKRLLVVVEGFTGDGARLPRRHFLCDADGKTRPVLVERPFSAPGVVDWPRLESLEKLSG